MPFSIDHSIAAKFWRRNSMFTISQLRDLEVMVEFYRDRCVRDSKKFHTTDSAKRMYAAERVKADDFLDLIHRHVRPFEVEGDESRNLSALGRNG